MVMLASTEVCLFILKLVNTCTLIYCLMIKNVEVQQITLPRNLTLSPDARHDSTTVPCLSVRYMCTIKFCVCVCACVCVCVFNHSIINISSATAQTRKLACNHLPQDID